MHWSNKCTLIARITSCFICDIILLTDDVVVGPCSVCSGNALPFTTYIDSFLIAKLLHESLKTVNTNIFKC